MLPRNLVEYYGVGFFKHGSADGTKLLISSVVKDFSWTIQ